MISPNVAAASQAPVAPYYFSFRIQRPHFQPPTKQTSVTCSSRAGAPQRSCPFVFSVLGNARSAQAVRPSHSRVDLRFGTGKQARLVAVLGELPRLSLPNMAVNE